MVEEYKHKEVYKLAYAGECVRIWVQQGRPTVHGHNCCYLMKHCLADAPDSRQGCFNAVVGQRCLIPTNCDVWMCRLAGAA